VIGRCKANNGGKRGGERSGKRPSGFLWGERGNGLHRKKKKTTSGAERKGVRRKKGGKGGNFRKRTASGPLKAFAPTKNKSKSHRKEAVDAGDKRVGGHEPRKNVRLDKQKKRASVKRMTSTSSREKRA